VLAALLLPLGLSGCVLLSESSDSVSASISKGLGSVSDSFKSLSGSSGGSGSSTASRYRADVREYTLASLTDADANGAAGTDGDRSLDFVRELGRIAELHGVTNWEGDANTAAAIREAVDSGAIDAAGVARLREELAPLGPQWVDAAVGAAR
jgi:hypothetical protein